MQFLPPHCAPASRVIVPHPSPHTFLFLTGILFCADPLPLLAERIAAALQHEEYTALPEGDVCGCLVTPENIWLWKTRASNDTIFYRRSGQSICWSTDPRSLATAQDLSQDALAHCCLGPAAYRLIPYRGMRVVKPVLRLAFADLLPPPVLRQKRGGWLSVPSQEYCVTHMPELLDLLGDASTQVARRGILDPKALRLVLCSQQLTRTYAKELIATAMTEVFVQQVEGASPSASSRRGA